MATSDTWKTSASAIGSAPSRSAYSRNEALRHEQFGREPVRLPLPGPLGGRDLVDIGRPAENGRTVGVEEMMTDLVRDREAAAQRRLVASYPDLPPLRQKQT